MHINDFADQIKKGRPKYKKIYIPKRGGGSREIFIPDEQTLLIQKAVLRDIENLADFPPCVMAFRKGISILDNAKAHLGNSYMIRYDLMNFFDTIDKDRVKDELSRRNFDASLIKVILKWCFGGGHLPQGAPTSPFLANLVCTNLDKRFSSLAKKLCATYTRYADDIIISGDKEIVKYQTLFKRIIRTEKFVINYRKTRVTVLDSFATRQDYSAEWFRDCHIVTGLAVDKSSVSVREAYLSELWRKIRDGEDSPTTRGKISFVAFVTPNEGAKMYQHLGKSEKQYFRVSESNKIGGGGLKKKFKENVDAIKLLKTLEREGRNATPNEQEILAKFNGWETIKKAFSNDADWQQEAQQLRELLTEEEYNSAHNVIGHSFFTSPEIARTIWKGIERLGFKAGRILDPSMGTGVFFGTMPSRMEARSIILGVEHDNLTGRIAQQLYSSSHIAIEKLFIMMPPKLRIEITDFLALSSLRNNCFNLVISNLPFGTTVYAPNGKDYKLNDYFFVKAMETLKPGGLMAFITSTTTLAYRKIYDELEGVADLIAAFKLPKTTFADSNVIVTSDFVIFQKRVDPQIPSEYTQSWREVGELVTDSGEKFTVNEYFINHREHMIGTPVKHTCFNGDVMLTLDGKGHDVSRELGELMNRLPEKIYRINNLKPLDISNVETIYINFSTAKGTMLPANSVN